MDSALLLSSETQAGVITPWQNLRGTWPRRPHRQAVHHPQTGSQESHFVCINHTEFFYWMITPKLKSQEKRLI